MVTRIFNTLSRAKEPFTPLVEGRLKMYVCGPTVYDEPHLGHARSAVVYDVIQRYFKAKGYAVTYVRNITDIDDKIIARARRSNRDYRALASYYTGRYHQAMDRLNVISPDAEPSATRFINPIQNFIAKLIQGGHAYCSGGSVYFSVPTFKNYGRLSGRSIQILPEVPPNGETGKKHPADFALWKKAVSGEPSWPSPWGTGRPGWHIECSAMSTGLLGPTFDIHGGGMDLIFPHHDNEIAQAESNFGTPPAFYWVHNGLVRIKGQKMSKSLGNSLTLDHLFNLYPPQALRLLMLSRRYRAPLDFSCQAMLSAQSSFARLERFFSNPAIPDVCTTPIDQPRGSLWFRFCSAMDDDFNFPMALSVVFQAIRRVNRQLTGGSGYEFCQDPNGLMDTVSDLSFICHSILGFTFGEIKSGGP